MDHHPKMAKNWPKMPDPEMDLDHPWPKIAKYSQKAPNWLIQMWKTKPIIAISQPSNPHSKLL